MLPSELCASIDQLVVREMGASVCFETARPVSGGCINQSIVVRTDGCQSLFVKCHEQAPNRFFESEAAGLDLIRRTGAVRVPAVVGYDVAHGGTSFLVLEWIEKGMAAPSFDSRFGRHLAEMHHLGFQDDFGWSQDNFLGSTLQPNGSHENWIEFWRTCRLGHQFKLATENRYGDQRFRWLAERLLSRLDELLDHNVRPSLLHGDLWSGNYMADSAGKPVVLDPAVYYGDREAEFGMTTLFGGLSPDFYAAYEEVWPLSAGSDERIEIYRLYHLLNHLNLFGTSYLAGCLKIMQKYA